MGGAPGVEPSCLGAASINDVMGAEIGGDTSCDTVDASLVANTAVVVWLTPSMGAMLGGEVLESMELLNNNQWNVQLLTLYRYQSLIPCRSMVVWATNEEEKIASLWKI